MQNLELLLLIISVVYTAFGTSIDKSLKKPYVLALLILSLSAHLLFEGVRWQMFPTYLIWIIALVKAVRPTKQKPRLIFRILGVTGLLILLIFAVLLPSVLPVFKLPQPTGSYTVGTKDIYLELGRKEIITADESDNRRLMVKVWYPSKEKEGEKDPYGDIGGRNGFAKKYGLSPSMLSYLNKIDSHVYRDIQIADQSFPVLIFSHGYHSRANGYYALLSEIVSQGYIVIGVNHTYESTGTTFPDGEEVYFDQEYAQRIESGTWDTIKPVIEAFKNGLSFEERQPIVRKAMTTYFVRDIVEYWAEDIKDVVSQLEDWSTSGFFKGKLDLNSIGVFGHSRGGGAAGEALLIDDRIKAGANLDGVQWGRIIDTAFQKPFLFVSADWPAEHENLNQHAYVNKSTAVFYQGLILDSGHSNFMDIPFMIPLQILNQAGSIDPHLAIEIASKMTISFFDKHLKNKKVDLKKLNQQYEKLKLNIFEGNPIK